MTELSFRCSLPGLSSVYGVRRTRYFRSRYGSEARTFLGFAYRSAPVLASVPLGSMSFCLECAVEEGRMNVFHFPCPCSPSLLARYSPVRDDALLQPRPGLSFSVSQKAIYGRRA